MHAVYVWMGAASSKTEYIGMNVCMNIVYTFTFGVHSRYELFNHYD